MSDQNYLVGVEWREEMTPADLADAWEICADFADRCAAKYVEAENEADVAQRNYMRGAAAAYRKAAADVRGRCKLPIGAADGAARN